MWQDGRLLAAIKALPPEAFLPGDGGQMLRRALRAAREVATVAVRPAAVAAPAVAGGLPRRRRTR